MEKLLHFKTFLLVAILALVGGSTALADEVKMDFVNKTFESGPNTGTTDLEEGTTFVQGVVTFTYREKGEGAGLRYWTDSKVRTYKDNVFAISVADGYEINTIVLNSTNKANLSSTNDAADGSFDTSNGTWTSTASGLTEVVFKKSNTGRCDISDITVTYTSTGGVVKSDPGLAFASTSATITLGDAFTLPTLTNNGDGAVTYTGNNDAVATITAAGAVSVVGAGTVTFTATSAETETYKKGTADFTLTVTRPAGEAITLPYSESFAEGLGDWTEEGDAVWTHNSRYSCAYARNSAGAADAYLVSPLIDLSGVTSAVISFDHAAYSGDMEGLTLVIRKQGGDWQELAIPSNPTGWTFVSTEDISVPAELIGEKVQVGLHYVSTASHNSTWDVKNFSIQEGTSVVKEDPTASFPQDTYNVYLGETFTAPALSTNSDGVVTYSSSATSVAEVDASTGAVTVKAVGSAVITATIAASETYNAATASYTLNVQEKPAEATTDEFEKVTDATTLKAGDIVVFVNEEENLAMAKYATGNNYPSTAVDIAAGKFTATTSVNQLTLEGDAEGWSFLNSNGKYVAATGGTKSNYLKDEAEISTKSQATIDIDADGNAVVTFLFDSSDNARNTLRFNHSNGQKKFAAYKASNTMHDVQLYRKVVVPADVDVTIGETGYATLYYGDRNLTVPEGVLATTYGVIDNEIVESVTYDEGDVIPAGEAVVLWTLEPGQTFTFAASETAPAKDSSNDLLGVDADTELSEAGYLFYQLSLPAGNSGSTVGFYWGSADGTTLSCGAHKAYLRIDASAGIRGFQLPGKQTGITATPASSSAEGQVFDLQGRRVSEAKQGLYIVNGKKVLVK